MLTKHYWAGLLFLVPLSACQTPDAQTALCRPDAAESLVGADRVTDQEAKRLTGAALVRQIKPGDPVTLDYRQERVTIETDQTSGKIVRAMCG